MGAAIHPSLDASILELGGDYFPGVDFELGSAPEIFETVDIAGVGQIALKNGSIFPQDGWIRAFEMKMGSNSRTFVNDLIISELNLPGAAESGYSGSPVYSVLTGEPFAIVLTGSAGTGSTQSSNILMLGDPSMSSFISQNVPEPTATLLVALGGAPLISRRSRKGTTPRRTG